MVKDRILYNICRYITKKEVIKDRDEKAIELYGEYANLNNL